MKTTINYSERYPDEKERKEAALDDLCQYLGGDTYAKIAKEITTLPNTEANRNAVRNMFDTFAGAVGYPVECFLDTFMGKERSDDE